MFTEKYALWIVLAALAVFAWLKIRWENKASETGLLVTGSPALTDEEEDRDFDCEPGSDGDRAFAESISAVEDSDELMEIVADYDLIDGLSAKALLEKAVQFDLDEDDWADIYQVAEEGSELERVAEEKAGNALA